MTEPQSTSESPLLTVGPLLYGDRWQRQLARDLDVSDRHLRRWVSGERSLPEWVVEQLAVLVRARAVEIDLAAASLREPNLRHATATRIVPAWRSATCRDGGIGFGCNLYYAWVRWPRSESSVVCPLVQSGGGGYVLSRAQAEAFLANPLLVAEDGAALERHLAANLECEGALPVSHWLDSRESWPGL